MADEIRRLQDIEEIKALKARYTRYVDAKDWDGYASLLTEDFHFISDGGEQHGRDKVVAVVSKAMGTCRSVHQVHNPEIVVDGDTASAVWPMNDYVEFATEPPYVIRGWGYYHEQYVRTPDGWRLKDCRMQRLRVDVEGQLPAQFAAHRS